MKSKSLAAVLVFSALSHTLFAADVKEYIVAKGQHFVQPSAGAAVLSTGDPQPYEFFAAVHPNGDGNVVSATLHPPVGANRVLSTNEDSVEFKVRLGFDSLTDLQSAFPAGNYQFSIVTAHEGTKTPTLSLPANLFPSAPHISNWDAAQAIDASSDFTLTWDAFNATNGFQIDLQINESSSGMNVLDTNLDVSATSVLIPAGTFTPGQTYNVRLEFVQGANMNTNAYVGATGLTGFFSQTKSQIATANPFGTFQFSAASYFVGENSNSVTVVVTRNGGSTGTATVQISTGGGTATSDADYTVTNAMLSFGEGVTTQSFTIQINDDALTEGYESFGVSLSNPTGGANLGSVSNANVVIIDDETPQGPDLQGFILAKGQNWKQTNAGAPVLASSTAFQFGAFAQQAYSGSITNATLLLASGGTVTLQAKDEDGGSKQLEYGQEFSTKSALDAAFGTGNYTFTFKAVNDGTNVATLNLPADNYPNTPHVANWAAAQAFDPGVDFTLMWDAMTGGTTNDFVQVSVMSNSTNGNQEVFYSGEAFDPEHLNGTATSVVIPAGTLSGNQTYEGELLFAKVNDRNTNYAGVTGFSAFFKQLRFTMKTGQATPPQGRIQFGSSSYSVSESGVTAAVSIVRTGGSSGTVSVDFDTTGGTATADSDYTAVSITVTFADGETNKTVNIPILDDVFLEGNETVTLALSNAQGGAVIGTGSATLTITDNETSSAGVLQFSSTAYSVNEGSAQATITVSRGGGTAGTVTVNYSTSPGTATAGSDYTTASGVLTLGAGVASKAFTVPIINDVVHETNETILLTLSSPGGGAALGARYSATLTIVDNDPLSIFQFTSTNYSVAENGKSIVVTVSRTGGTAAANVSFATANGTATAVSDYTATNGTLAFAAGVLSKTFTVPILDDSAAEGNQTVLLSLSNPTGLSALGSRSNSMVTILDNDFGGAISFTATNFSVSETSVVATITVARSNGVAGGVTVNYTTIEGSATDGLDYTNVAGQLAFGTNETKKTFTVPLIGDSLPEGNETVQLRLMDPTGGATLGKISNSILTILDNEATLQFSTTNYSVPENSASANIVVQRTGSGAGTVSVGYTTGDGTAVAGTEYTAKSGVLTFGAGVMSQSISVPILNDTVADGNKALNLFLTNVTGIALGQQSNAVLTIVDDEKAGVLTFSSPTYSISETGKVATITVMRTNGLASGVSVNFAASSSTATAGSDFVSTNGTFNFAANETKKTFTVRILDDFVIEGPENVSLTLSNPQGGATLGTSNAILAIIDNDVGTVLRFSTNVYRASETNGSALITVLRSGGLANSVSVNYSTTDGSATAADYTSVSGTLLFGPNVISNTFMVPITFDSQADADETVSLHLSSPSGTAVLGTLSNATLVITEPKPILALYPTSITLIEPRNCSQTFVISNAGPAGSYLQYQVADDGALGGFLNVVNSSGVLGAGNATTVSVSVKSEFVNDLDGFTLALNVYTPGAANYVKYPISVPIVGDNVEVQKLIGTWSGTWSGSSYGRNNPGEAMPSAPVGGTWTLNIASVDINNQTASGSLTWNGTDAYWTYTMDNFGTITSATPHDFIPNRTIAFNSSNTTLSLPNNNACGQYTINIQGFANAPNPSDAFYGPQFTVDLVADTGAIVPLGVSWSAHPYNPSNADTAVSNGSVTGHKN